MSPDPSQNTSSSSWCSVALVEDCTLIQEKPWYQVRMGEGGNKQAAWRCRAQTVVVMDVEPKERFTRAGEHPAQAVRAWQALGVRTCQL